MATQAISEATVITILSTSGRPTLITGSSIQMPIQIQSAIATVPVNVTAGSLNVGSITLVVDVATVSDILGGTVDVVQQVGTVGVVAAITGTVSVQVIAGTVDVTVLGTPSVQVAGGTIVPQPGTVSYQYIQAAGLATVKATAGTFYGAMVAGESGLSATAATVVVLNNLSTIAVFVAPSGDARQFDVPQGGVGFATLVVNVSSGEITVFYS